MTPRELSQRLATDVENVCRRLLPNGNRVGANWCVGSIAGEEGSSLKVCLSGNKSGLWADFAANHRGDMIDLCALTLNVNIRDAILWAKSYLGIHDTFDAIPKAKTIQPLKPLSTDLPSEKILEWFKARGIHQIH